MNLKYAFLTLAALGLVATTVTAQGEPGTIPVQDLKLVQETGDAIAEQATDEAVDENSEGVAPYYRAYYRPYYRRPYYRAYYRAYYRRPYYRAYYRAYYRPYYRAHDLNNESGEVDPQAIPEPQFDPNTQPEQP